MLVIPDGSPPTSRAIEAAKGFFYRAVSVACHPDLDQSSIRAILKLYCHCHTSHACLSAQDDLSLADSAFPHKYVSDDENTGCLRTSSHACPIFCLRAPLLYRLDAQQDCRCYSSLSNNMYASCAAANPPSPPPPGIPHRRPQP